MAKERARMRRGRQGVQPRGEGKGGREERRKGEEGFAL